METENRAIHAQLDRIDGQIKTWGASAFDHPYVRGLRARRDALVQQLRPISDYTRGWNDAMDGKHSAGEAIHLLYRQGYAQGLRDIKNVNQRLDRLAQRYTDGEFQGPGEYLAAVTRASGPQVCGTCGHVADHEACNGRVE